MCSKTEMQLQKKAKCPMKGNYQVNDVLYKRDVTSPLSKKCILDWGRENGRRFSIITSYRLNKIDIPIRQYFQVPCGA